MSRGRVRLSDAGNVVGMLTPRTTVGRRALSALELVILLAIVAALFAGAIMSIGLQLATALQH